MRIGMDITPATAHRTGVGEYVLHVLEHLVPQLSAGERLLGWSTGLHAPVSIPAAVSSRHYPVPTRAAYALWRHFPHPCVDRLLGGVDVFHATNYFLPPTAKAKRVLSIYDLSFLVEPRWASPKIVGPFSREVPRFAREADAVLTCSEHSRQDIVRLCGLPADRVHVAYGAPDPIFAPQDRAVAQSRMRAVLGCDSPYVLYVGTLEPRKNIETLLRAFAAVKDCHPHRLLFVGATGWNMGHLTGLIEELGLVDRVSLPGYLPTRQDLVAAYSAADLFVLPSHYEGFGLPLVEAMACGCPAIASNTSCLPEVGGDAVCYFPAPDDTSLAQSMTNLLGNPELRGAMSAKGLVQAKRFAWDDTARRILALYRSLA
jgi:glycosyltransferase involved in cell wall biosynthesis